MTLYKKQWSRPSPRKRNVKRQKWLSEEAYSWEKNRSERQRRKGKIIPPEYRVPKNVRKDKEAFLSDECKETEENNRMGKTRDLFKKIRDTKGIFHVMMGSIKDWSSMDITEAEDIKERWHEYTEELYKKIFMTQIITMVWSLTWSQTPWNVKSNGP